GGEAFVRPALVRGDPARRQHQQLARIGRDGSGASARVLGEPEAGRQRAIGAAELACVPHEMTQRLRRSAQEAPPGRNGERGGRTTQVEQQVERPRKAPPGEVRPSGEGLARRRALDLAQAGRGAKQIARGGITEHVEVVSLAQDVRKRPRGEHGFAEVGWRDEEDGVHQRLALGARRVNAKSTNAAPLRGAAENAKWWPMSGPCRLNRTLIEVSGPDARDFLNNLLTQNLDRLDGAQLAYGALLMPQGKILADMLIWRTDQGVVLEADPEHADELERRLGMYRLRAQAKIERSARQGVLWSPHPFDGAHADPRLADLGYRRLGAPSEAPSGDSAYDALRL